jgi:hypothetical protein
MPFTRAAFTLSWFVPPTESDWRNLNVSGVGRVMVGYGLAKSHRDVVAHLAALGKRVVVRMTEPGEDSPTACAQVLGSIVRLVPVDAVILPPNEPDHRYDLGYGSATWGAEDAYRARSTVDDYRAACRGVGLRAVAPALMIRSVSEDEPPAPGRTAWREILAPSAHLCDGVGVHIYGYGWQGVADELRFKFALKQAAEWWHRPLWIDEVGIPGGTDVEQMRAYIAMADILLTYPVGQRVEMLAPFSSTGDPGDPPAWDARYVIRDMAAYTLLGDWMRR